MKDYKYAYIFGLVQSQGHWGIQIWPKQVSPWAIGRSDHKNGDPYSI